MMLIARMKCISHSESHKIETNMAIIKEVQTEEVGCLIICI